MINKNAIKVSRKVLKEKMLADIRNGMEAAEAKVNYQQALKEKEAELLESIVYSTGRPEEATAVSSTWEPTCTFDKS